MVPASFRDSVDVVVGVALVKRDVVFFAKVDDSVVESDDEVIGDSGLFDAGNGDF